MVAVPTSACPLQGAEPADVLTTPWELTALNGSDDKSALLPLQVFHSNTLLEMTWSEQKNGLKTVLQWSEHWAQV